MATTEETIEVTEEALNELARRKADALNQMTQLRAQNDRCFQRRVITFGCALPILLLGWYLTTTSAQYATHEHYYRWWLGAILITAALVPSIVVSLMWLGASRWEHRQQLNSAVGFINQREAEVRQV